MGVEIERKFLVLNENWRPLADTGRRMRQGYLASGASSSVRVRVAGDTAFLTIKSAESGLRRLEYEYPIPCADADQILDRLCEGGIVEKTRYLVRHGMHTWEVDVFAGDNAGLVLAELELASEDETFDLPAWLGGEVSHERRYYNAYLARHPYTTWNQR